MKKSLFLKILRESAAFQLASYSSVEVNVNQNLTRTPDSGDVLPRSDPSPAVVASSRKLWVANRHVHVVAGHPAKPLHADLVPRSPVGAVDGEAARGHELRHVRRFEDRRQVKLVNLRKGNKKCPNIPSGGLPLIVRTQKWGFSCKVQRRPPADIILNESLPTENNPADKIFMAAMAMVLP